MSWNDGKLKIIESRMRPIIKSAILLAIVIIVLNIGLLVYGYLSAGPDRVFGGLIYNPLDGNSYLAKMKMGFNGAWRFTLPYECESGAGGYVYLYYLFLGHLSSWLGCTCLFMYHFARLCNGLILILSLAVFFGKTIPDRTWAGRALWLTILGSGMGWLALPFNIVTADMVLAEGYPFLSILANPHFPLGLAIFMGVFTLTTMPDNRGNCFLIAILCLLLSIIQPFLLVNLYILLFFITTYRLVLKKGFQIKRLLFGLAGGFPYLVYQLWIMQTDPFLSQWSVQNLTPAPPIWNLLLSLSPVVLFTIFSIVNYRRLRNDNKYELLIWFLMTLLIAYLPFALQRRFLAGIYIACSILAILGISTLIDKQALASKFYRVIFSLSLPGTIIITLIMASGIITRSPSFYLTRSEADAIIWLGDNTPTGSLVLASPEMGAYIPVHSNNCVLYGHPFESLDSETREQALISFFSGVTSEALIQEIPQGLHEIYLFYGPRERKLGSLNFLRDLPVAYTNAEVTIYEYPQE